MFYQGMQLGGQPDHLGKVASTYSMGLDILRTKRTLVAKTFTWLLIPLHLVLTALLLLVVEIVAGFSRVLSQAAESLAGGAAGELAGYGVINFVNPADVILMRYVLLVVVTVMSLMNAVTMFAASGGHSRKFFFYASLMFGLAGLNAYAVPELVHLFLNPMLSKIQP